MIQNDRSFLRTPYLTEQIIPYIGNKRRLLPLIYRALCSVSEEGFSGKSFLDLFSGSGVVSRLAKYLGFEVYANDWEYYSYVLSYAFVAIDKKDLVNMYTGWGGIENVITHLNSLPKPQIDQEFIARYFCPEDDTHPDYRKERLFYTRANGLTIDKIRNELEQLYPAQIVRGDKSLFREKLLLLSLLVYQAATHTNTSGVFKAYHKGFGGFSGDALSRILKPISLQYPVLVDSKQRMSVYREDANKLLQRDSFANKVFDIVYLDPPYNQHQYGSNYHLLNTIALWDKLSLEESSLQRGGKYGKAGIRKDWINTRSDYCYREKARSVFKDLISRLRSRHILVSYSTEGIIPFQELIGLCSERGKVSLVTDEYIKYRGGRQSINRLNNNIEFVILIDTAGKTVLSDLDRIEDTVNGRKLNLQLKKSYSRRAMVDQFVMDEEHERIGFSAAERVLWIQTMGFYRIVEKDLNKKVESLGVSSPELKEVKKELIRKLSICECRNKVQELHELLGILSMKNHVRGSFITLVPNILKKIAHKKYKDLFFTSLEKVRSLKPNIPEAYEKIEEKIDKIEELALKRFNG